MKRVALILSFMLIAVSGFSQVALDSIKSIAKEMVALQDKDYVRVRYTADSIIYMIYTDLRAHPDSCVQGYMYKYIGQKEAARKRFEKQYRKSQESHLYLCKRMKELSKLAQSIKRWESRVEGESMCSMIFSDREFIKYEFKAYNSSGWAMGWLVYTYVRKEGEPPFPKISKKKKI